MNRQLFSPSFDFGRHSDLDDARKALENSNSHPNALFRYANALAANGHYQLAVEMFLAAAEQSGGNSVETSFRAGVCMLFNGFFGEAALAFDAALAELPERYDLHSFLGMALYHLGLTGRANIHWWAASQINETVFIRNIISQFFIDDCHPERLALYPICIGKGIDVGCGNRKTHPDAIGVDLIPSGSKGTVGCVSGKISVADVMASGDHLPMFADNELDYVVQRHNLEHYQYFIKAIQEWKRIVKPGGLIGMVVPDDDVCDTIRLDPTHKHVFTQHSLARAIHLVGGMRIISLGPLLKNWSFLCVVQKTQSLSGDSGRCFDYEAAVRRFEQRQAMQQAQDYEKAGNYKNASDCHLYMKQRFGGHKAM